MDSADIMPAEVIFPPLPQTPSESPLIKQQKIESLDTASVLSQFKELSRLINNRSDALERMVGCECPQSGVSTEDGETQQILGMVQCHGRDPPSLLLPSDSIKDTLVETLQRSNHQTFC
ncbi:hypothetical protein DPX16_1687 [Anabarilius grahami]|uniref:Uncharacterized protein n=1 Tax=Anabarilius grahami TaxID=495550 RepID=A0A3N0XJ99_ANAGA|nr:hypothetical protein DPX16_1687 [Anabarilius grahami]